MWGGRAVGRDETPLIRLPEIGLKHCGQRGSTLFSEREEEIVLVQEQAGVWEGGMSPTARVQIPILPFTITRASHLNPLGFSFFSI